MADYPAAVELWQASDIRVETPEDLAAKLRRDPDLFLVAQDHGRVVGVILGGFDGRMGSINRLAVAQSYRRSGLAKRLVTEVEQRLREKGALRIYAWIHDYNAPSRALFAQQGYDEWSDVVTVSKSLLT